MWHVRAEAQRQIRNAEVPVGRASALVDLLVDEVLDGRSVALAAPRDGVDEPQALRRMNGSSVYTVRLCRPLHVAADFDVNVASVIAAGRRDGSAVDESAVELALLEMAANRPALDTGQAGLVRQMCTSGAHCSLRSPLPAAIRPPRCVPILAWTQDGGQVIGLARPRPQPLFLASRPASAPTPAKLTWSLRHGELPTGRPRSARQHC